MTGLYVIDTNGLIAYFKEMFQEDRALSEKARRLIRFALESSPSEVRLSIPAVVFIEVFEKWFTDEEFASKFHYEAFVPIRQSPNVEIRSIDQEVLERLIQIRGTLSHHDIHDKIVLASAMALNCPLITVDKDIIHYVDATHVIPATVT